MADPRTEAERLVATALAALTMATRGTEGFATGSAECCVCPVCKAIAAARDPSPQFAERLATGVGDLASGLASVLRAFGDTSGSPSAAPEGHDAGEAPESHGATPQDHDADGPPAAGGPAGDKPRGSGDKPRDSGDVWHDATH
jgi:hypothetical protein